MKKILCAILACSLMFCIVSCGDSAPDISKADTYEEILAVLEDRAEKVTIFTKEEIDSYEALMDFKIEEPEAGYIINMCYARMEDGTDIRCIEAYSMAESIAMTNRVAAKYSVRNATIIMYGSSDLILEFPEEAYSNIQK